MTRASRIKTLLKNDNALRLGKNFAWLSILQIVSYVFPLITLPYLAKVIGVTGYGKIAFAGAIMVWLQTITNWGFQYTSTRDISRNRENKDKVSDILSNTIWASTFLMIICAIVLVGLCLIVPKFKANSLVLFMTFLMLPGHILFPEWFFQALERMKYITLLNLFSRALFTISIFVFIKHASQYYLQPLLTSLGYIFSGVIASYFIFQRWGYRLRRPQFKTILDSLRKSTDVFVNEIVPNFYNSLSVIILGFFWGPSANGILDVGTRFASVGMQLNGVVSRTFFPLLSREIRYHKYLIVIQLITAGIFAVGLILGAPLIIKLFYTSEFNAAIPVIRILGFSIFFIALSSVFGTNYLIIQGYERPLRNITLKVSVFGCCLAVMLISKYSYLGAALTIGITRVLLGSSTMIWALRVKNRDNCQDKPID